MPEWFSYIGDVILGAGSGFLVVWAKMAKYQQKVDDLIDERKAVRDDLKLLRTDVDKLNEFKVNAQKFIDSKIYQSNSPLTLTPFGLQLVQESGFESIFATVKDDLAARLHQKKPKTKYDAQEMARELMDGLTEYPEFAPIKTYAFKTGKDFGQILRAGAIMLRDHYLAVHQEIKD